MGIYNSAVVPFGDGFAAVFRLEDRTRFPRLHMGWSDDGLQWHIEPSPISFENRPDDRDDVSDYAYDPRVVKIEGRYYITWCGGTNGPTISMAETRDFQKFTRLENAFLPHNRNGVLFPRRIDGKYFMLSRPSDNGHTPFGDIYISQSPDLIHWGRHRRVMGRGGDEHGLWWQRTKIGAGPVPIETAEGWLMIYHGVLDTCNGFVYHMGAAILDREQPWKVVYRCKNILLAPEADYEVSGHVPNVVFPVAALCDEALDRLAIYYGAADTVTCLCYSRLSELMSYIKEHSLVF
jgi:beta-1,4-mannooligosaccharide/beta-1,4-mannosyl-N-acetylglucosamine phosphorylase